MDLPAQEPATRYAMPEGRDNATEVSLPICTRMSSPPPPPSLNSFKEERRVTTSISHRCCPGRDTNLCPAAPFPVPAGLPPLSAVLTRLWDCSLCGAPELSSPFCSDSVNTHEVHLSDRLCARASHQVCSSKVWRSPQRFWECGPRPAHLLSAESSPRRCVALHQALSCVTPRNP